MGQLHILFLRTRAASGVRCWPARERDLDLGAGARRAQRRHRAHLAALLHVAGRTRARQPHRVLPGQPVRYNQRTCT